MVHAIVCGMGIGILSGMLGIGGGPILIPILLYAFSLDMPHAAGTSLAIIIPTALVGVVTHYSKGNVNLALASWIAVGGMIGAFLGSSASSYVPSESLKKLFAVILIYMALKILFAGKA